MGVDIYLLKRGGAVLEIAGICKKVGTLKKLCKVTELNQWHEKQMDACHEAVQGKPSPVAVLAWPVGVFPLDASNKGVDARLVLAWEPNRSAVTDWNADCLPVLGYALMDSNSRRHVLCEERKGVILPISLEKAKEKSLLDGRGNLIRKSAPRIMSCKAIEVHRKLGFDVAKCVLQDGQVHEVWTEIDRENIPMRDWYLGKKPSEAKVFPRA